MLGVDVGSTGQTGSGRDPRRAKTDGAHTAVCRAAAGSRCVPPWRPPAAGSRLGPLRLTALFGRFRPTLPSPLLDRRTWKRCGGSRGLPDGASRPPCGKPAWTIVPRPGGGLKPTPFRVSTVFPGAATIVISRDAMSHHATAMLATELLLLPAVWTLVTAVARTTPRIPCVEGDHLAPRAQGNAAAPRMSSVMALPPARAGAAGRGETGTSLHRRTRRTVPMPLPWS
jgi:hypothetical protein